MDKDEIIKLAREAGLGEYLYLDGWRFTPDGDDMKSLERFFNLAFAAGEAYEREKQTDISALPIIIEVAVKEAVLAERELCAKVCDEQFKKYGCVADKCATAIRARGEK